MNLTRDRVRSIGWAFVLTICLALTAGLTLRVNAVKGRVYDAERRIVSVKQDIRFLETEFQTRANQQQLKALNDVEFGYSAPRAAQYIEGERQLAALGKARAPGAPSPIRVASAVREGRKPDDGFIAMVSPMSGQAETPGTAETHETAPAHADADVVGATIAETGAGDGRERIKLTRAEGQ